MIGYWDWEAHMQPPAVIEHKPIYVWYTAKINRRSLWDYPYDGRQLNPSNCEWMVPGTVDPTVD